MKSGNYHPEDHPESYGDEVIITLESSLSHSERCFPKNKRMISLFARVVYTQTKYCGRGRKCVSSLNVRKKFIPQKNLFNRKTITKGYRVGVSFI